MLVLTRSRNQAVVIFSDSGIFPTLCLTVVSIDERGVSLTIENEPGRGGRPQPRRLQLYQEAVLGRCCDEERSQVTVKLIRLTPQAVGLGVAAPQSVTIDRLEIALRKRPGLIPRGPQAAGLKPRR